MQLLKGLLQTFLLTRRGLNPRRLGGLNPCPKFDWETQN